MTRINQSGSLGAQLLKIIIIPLVLVALGVIGAFVVFKAAPATARAEPERPLSLVEVLSVRGAQATTVIRATGVVVPSQRLILTPEVSGKLVSRSPALVPGGRVEAGEVLARIDARDYRHTLAQEEARVASAELGVTSERGRGKVARLEWQLLGDAPTAEESPLAMREPHLRSAIATLEAARSSVARARLNLSRTVLRAPWNAIVLEADAEVGQVVGPGTRVATLIGTDMVWIKATVDVNDLLLLDVPGLSSTRRSSAKVLPEGLAGATTWTGEVVRLEGQLDEETRTAQIVIEVDAPFEPAAGMLPLLPGTFVNLELTGRELDNVYKLPREAVRDGDTVWVVDVDERLRRRAVEVRWGSREDVYITAGLDDGERVVVTGPARPLEGEQVRVSRATSWYEPSRDERLASAFEVATSAARGDQ